jgi:hypothetical protein
MPDGANEPAAVPVPPRPEPRPAAGRRGAVLLFLGGCVGMALGVLLTVGVTSTYTLVTHTIPETRDSVEVFNQLNELRQQINQMNEDQKLKDQEKEDALRQALRAVASKAPAPESGTPSADPAARKEAAAPEARPVMKAQDGFAEIDEEIARLEQTQKVLNTILDVFSRKAKERAKDREEPKQGRPSN